MIIVAGSIQVRPGERTDYLAGCAEVIRQARATAGCLDFHLTADPIEPDRINVFEQWESAAAVAAFRGSGPSQDQHTSIVSASVAEYDVRAQRGL